MTSFAAFGLRKPLGQAVQEAGYTAPTPIQSQAIPLILKGKDVVGIAQTGTGKTAAFVLPILQHLLDKPKVVSKGLPRVLILVPTRELAMQIAQSFTTYGKHTAVKCLTLFGGVPQGPQTHALSKGIDVIIATPGRFIDLRQQGFIDLSAVEFFVLDEADRMLDMGFSDDIRLIAKHIPHDRQTLLFSATLQGHIASLIHSYLRNPVRVTITAESTTVAKTEQIVMFVDKEDKPALLCRILANPEVKRAIVFVRMKHVADRLVIKLAANQIVAQALHSDKTQAMRTQTMEDFRAGKTKILIATDIASRGIDVDDISHVINFNLPKDTETYVHRIGRTARAGASGVAISFCDEEDRKLLDAIQKLINKKLTVKEHKYHSTYAQNGGEKKAPSVGAPPKTGRGGGRPKKSNSNHRARKSKNWRQE